MIISTLLNILWGLERRVPLSRIVALSFHRENRFNKSKDLLTVSELYRHCGYERSIGI